MRKVLRFFSSFYFKNLMMVKKKFFISAGVLISQAGVAVILPIPLSFIIDYVLKKDIKALEELPIWLRSSVETQTPYSLLLIGLGAMAAVNVVSNLLDLAEQYFVTRVSNDLTERTRKQLFSAVTSHTKLGLDGQRRADLIGKLSQDALNIQILFQTALPVLVRAVPSLVMIIFVLFRLDALLAWCMIVFAAAMFLITYYFTKKVTFHRKRFRQDSTHYEQFGLQTITNFMVVRLFNLELFTKKKMARMSRTTSYSALRASLGEGYLMASMAGLKVMLKIVVLAVGGLAVINGQFTLGRVMMILSYVDAVSGAMKDLTKFAFKSARAFASIDLIEEFLSESEKQSEQDGLLKLPASKAVELKLENVSFGFRPQIPVVESFTDTFRSGDVIALMAPSGFGKSTLLNLVARLLRPQGGRILLNGIDLNDLRAQDLRQSMTYTLQENFIFRGSIRDNLTLFADHPVKDADLWSALADVCAADLVKSLPEGLDTEVGEGAFYLSTGQSRRLCLARAYLRSKSQIFLFDEPTAGLEPHSRLGVVQSLKDLADRGAIVLYTTHRTDELNIATRIVSLQHSEVGIGKAESSSESPHLSVH